MVKTKQKHTGEVPGKKSVTSDHHIDSPGCDIQYEDCDWVVVKKQRVTILVPAAPPSESSITANQGRSDTHILPPEVAINHMQLPMETFNVHPSGNEHENTTVLAAQKEIQDVGRSPPPLPKSTLVKLPRVDQRTELENPHGASTLKSHKLLEVCNTSRAIRQPRTILVPRRSSYLATSLSQGLRASNLERKLERAGGLSKWLNSLGLGQFARIFQGRSLNKYQLVNLTMEKLKDMGASAVGPRRKLIHAIDCVCQPYCFEVL